jgi:hypothetical protein
MSWVRRRRRLTRRRNLALAWQGPGQLQKGKKPPIGDSQKQDTGPMKQIRMKVIMLLKMVMEKSSETKLAVSMPKAQRIKAEIVLRLLCESVADFVNCQSHCQRVDDTLGTAPRAVPLADKCWDSHPDTNASFDEGTDSPEELACAALFFVLGTDATCCS